MIASHKPPKVRFLYQCSDHLSHSKNFTFLFPLIFLSKHISLYALGRIRWILDIIWPLNQHFKLKNQRNWLNQVWMWKFWNVMNWGNTVVLGRMYRWMRSSFRGIGGQSLLRGEAFTAFTDTSDPELLYSHCWQVKTCIFNLVKNHVLAFLGGL